MTCGTARDPMLDLARGVAMPAAVRVAVRQHLAVCTECAAAYGRQQQLTAALAELSEEARASSASPETEGRLREAFAARLASLPPSSSRPAPARLWRYGLASAAAIALAMWAAARPGVTPAGSRVAPRKPPVATTTPEMPGSRPTPASATARTPSPAVRVAANARRTRPAAPKRPRSFEFMTLPGAAGLPDLESASVVRIEVPIAALPGYGVEIVPNALKQTVEADVLVGQDGQPRAIRLIGTDESTHDTRSRR